MQHHTTKRKTAGLSLAAAGSGNDSLGRYCAFQPFFLFLIHDAHPFNYAPSIRNPRQAGEGVRLFAPSSYAGVNSLCHYTQTGLHWHKLYSGFVQYPRFNFEVPHAQQVKRAADIVLLTHTLRLVSLYLRTYPGGHLYPLAQTGKATAQAVQTHIQTGSSTNSVIRSVRVGQVPGCRGRA